MNYKSLRVVRQNADWIVWRGAHPTSGDRCLIKQVNPQAAEPQRLAPRLHEEYQFFKNLSDPRLVRVRAWESYGPRVLFEDMQGSMAQVLATEQRLPADLVANVMQQCLQGLAYLHGKKFGHGAIDLQTILVAPNGQVKFGDFLGYRFDQLTPPPAPEQQLKYQAPEVIDSTFGTCSPSSDLYNLGYACLEMLAGRDFESLFGIDEQERERGVNWLGWHADPAKVLSGLAEMLPYVPQAMVKIIEVMIAKVPAERGYPSATQLLQHLEEFGLLSGRGVPALKAPVKAKPNPAAAPRPVQPASEQTPRPTRSLAGSATKAEGRPGLRLVWQWDGPQVIQELRPGDSILLGRQEGCDLVLPDPTAAAQHALLVCQDSGKWWVYDLRSPGGTFVNGKPVRQSMLNNGDELQFSQTLCRVQVNEAAAKQAAPRQQQPTMQVRNVVLQELIHQGQTGELYRGIMHLNTGPRVVAVRLYGPEFQHDPEQIRRFLRGIPLAARMRHPNIVRLYRGGAMLRNGKPTWYLAMEYMPGGSLRDRLAKSRERMPVADVIRFALDITSALTAAAEEHLLHRNINPSCVLFAADGTAKVSDFVLLRGEVLDSIQQITRAGAPPGEHVYQPPEVVEGRAALGPACDIYSLAATMYEALTLHPPFSKEQNLPTIIESILRAPVVPPRKYNPDVSPELEQLLLCGLEKRPESRFSTAAEFADSLRRQAELQPVG